MPRPTASHLTDQQRHARAGRAQMPPARTGAGDKARHSRAASQAALNGPGDYFNMTGQRIKHVPGVNGLIRVVSGKDVRLLSQVNVHDGKNLKLVADIAAHYAKGVLHLSGVYGASKEHGEEAIAYTLDENHTYLAANKAGFVSSDINNYHNLMSVLIHERNHRDDDSRRVPNSFDSHFKVYLRQFNDSSFAASTLLFKIGEVNNAVQYLYNDYMPGRKNYQQIGFSESIDSLNQILDCYRIVVEAAANGSEFTIHSVKTRFINGKCSAYRASEVYTVKRKKDAH